MVRNLLIGYACFSSTDLVVLSSKPIDTNTPSFVLFYLYVDCAIFVVLAEMPKVLQFRFFVDFYAAKRTANHSERYSSPLVKQFISDR
jgi:hypothetical protein